MDRKSIVGIALAILVFVLAQHQQLKHQRLNPAPATPSTSETQASASPSAAPSAPETAAATPAATPAPLEAAPAATVPEETQVVGNGAVDYTFTNLGGGIATLKLLNHQGAQPGERMVLNNGASHPIGALVLHPEKAPNTPYTVTVEGDQVICETTVPPGISVKKIYTLNRDPKAAYRLGLEVVFQNKSAGAVEYPAYYVFTGLAHLLYGSDVPMYIGFDYFAGHSNSFITPDKFDAGRIPLIGIETSAAKPFYAQSPGNVLWAGVRNQYFTTMLLPEGTTGQGVWARQVPGKLDGHDVKGIEGFLEMPGFKLVPGETVRKNFTVYSGPAELEALAALGSNATAMTYIDRWWITRTVGTVLLRSMNALQGFLHSYAWAIIVLTFIVRGLLWPIQGRANRSMKRMQLLMPKQTELRDKYKDDPARMNQEVMKLYKQYGVNPLSGCLPMLIQIPIFIGFYSMLGTAVELRNSSFLWVHDLSRPDTIFHLAGFPVNILPIAMALTMVWQMQLTPKAGDPSQQKIMMLMPLIFVVFTYNFASALALYYTVQNLLSILQLYVTRNQPMPALEKAKKK
ncbi:MAG: membrane protein insertase YidC [Chthoniobacteraceae bacterium]